MPIGNKISQLQPLKISMLNLVPENSMVSLAKQAVVRVLFLDPSWENFLTIPENLNTKVNQPMLNRNPQSFQIQLETILLLENSLIMQSTKKLLSFPASYLTLRFLTKETKLSWEKRGPPFLEDRKQGSPLPEPYMLEQIFTCSMILFLQLTPKQLNSYFKIV